MTFVSICKFDYAVLLRERSKISTRPKKKGSYFCKLIGLMYTLFFQKTSGREKKMGSRGAEKTSLKGHEPRKAGRGEVEGRGV